jgi:hypothetical protein
LIIGLPIGWANRRASRVVALFRPLPTNLAVLKIEKMPSILMPAFHLNRYASEKSYFIKLNSRCPA